MSWRLEKRADVAATPDSTVTGNVEPLASAPTGTIGNGANTAIIAGSVAAFAVGMIAIGALVYRKTRNGRPHSTLGRKGKQPREMESARTSGGDSFYPMPDAVVLPSPLTELPPNSPFRKDFTPPRASRAGAGLQGRTLNKVVGHRSVMNATTTRKVSGNGSANAAASITAPPISATRGFVMAQAPRRPSWRPGQDMRPGQGMGGGGGGPVGLASEAQHLTPAPGGLGRLGKKGGMRPSHEDLQVNSSNPPQSPARFW